jgi:hypothetical protein
MGDSIQDLSGQKVSLLCKGRCRRDRTATLVRSDAKIVEPNSGGSRQAYAGHKAKCDTCGNLQSDFYNWGPQ